MSKWHFCLKSLKHGGIRSLITVKISSCHSKKTKKCQRITALTYLLTHHQKCQLDILHCNMNIFGTPYFFNFFHFKGFSNVAWYSGKLQQQCYKTTLWWYLSSFSIGVFLAWMILCYGTIFSVINLVWYLRLTFCKKPYYLYLHKGIK